MPVPPVTQRLIVISDLHVGPDPPDGAPRYNMFAGAEQFPRFAKKIARGDHLVLNGDIFDFLLDGDPLSMDRALARATALLNGAEGAILITALAGILARGGQVTLRLGNHDPELAVQTVADEIQRRLPGIQLTIDPYETFHLGQQRVVVAHGEADDDANRFRHGAINGAGFTYPPGSKLVKLLLNRVKADYGLAFADLLKPDIRGGALAVLAVKPTAVKLLFQAGIPPMLKQWLSRCMFGNPYAAVGAAGGGAGYRGGAVPSELEILAAKELDKLLDQQQGALRVPSLHELREDVRATWLRVGLQLTARLQRLVAGDASETYFALDPSRQEQDYAQRLADEHRGEVVVLGHTHAARLGRHGRVTLANSGTWIPLMQLPAADAPIDEWVELLRTLRDDPALEGRGKDLLIKRFTAVEVTPEGECLRVALTQYQGAECIPLRVVLTPARLQPQPAMAAHAPVSRAAVGREVSYDEAIAHRRQRLHHELDHWAARNPQVPGQLLVPAELREALHDQAKALLAQVAIDGYEALDQLADAEVTWDLYRIADMQRRDLHLGQRLQYADAIALDGYRTVIDAARKAGFVPATGARWPLPLVYLEAGLSPATYRRGANVRAPALGGGRRLDLPFPVILLPPDHLAAPWLLTVILHEVGHDLDHDMGLGPQLGRALVDKLNGHPLSDHWRMWVSEILADLIGLHLAGPGFINSLRRLAEPFNGWGWRVGGVHPPLPLRLDILQRCLDGGAALYPAPPAFKRSELVHEYTASIDDVLAALLDSPLDGMKVTLRELLPKPVYSDEQWRSLPGFMQQRLVERQENGAQGSEDEVGAPENVHKAHDKATFISLGEEFDRLASGLPQPDWAVDAQYRTFIAKQVPRFAPTILQPGSLFKVPPLELLRRFDECWFVGATNGQLLSRIEQAFRQRGGKPWQRLVFFFLRDAGLRDIAESDEQAEQLVRERDRASAELNAMLRKGYAAEHALLGYDKPFCFASFWRGNGVRRVHVSAKVWGVDIRSCPAVDYRAVEGQENPQLDAYFVGLETLCGLAGRPDLAPA